MSSRYAGHEDFSLNYRSYTRNNVVLTTYFASDSVLYSFKSYYCEFLLKACTTNKIPLTSSCGISVNNLLFHNRILFSKIWFSLVNISNTEETSESFLLVLNKCAIVGVETVLEVMVNLINTVHSLPVRLL